MGAAIGWFIGTVVAVLIGVFVWTPLLGDEEVALFAVCFWTGWFLAGAGLALGEAYLG